MAIGDGRVLIPPAPKRGSVVFVKALLEHPEDTGFFRTAEGVPIPAYFVQRVVVKYGDDEVATFEWTSGVSRDPSVTFPLRMTKEAPVTITWTDNKGGVYTHSADVKFAPDTQ
jgi:sulfur-oxidizing protein SoxZ